MGQYRMPLWLLVHSDRDGTPVGMATRTASLVAQCLWAFILEPNFSPLFRSALPMFNVNCPFLLEPLPVLFRD